MAQQVTPLLDTAFKLLTTTTKQGLQDELEEFRIKEGTYFNVINTQFSTCAIGISIHYSVLLTLEIR